MVGVYAEASRASQRGDCREAVRLYERMIGMKPESDELKLSPPRRWAQNDLAWTLATCPDDAVRDGERALALAQRLNAEAPHTVAYVVTLAAAYAEVGRYEDAVRAQREALTLLPLSHPGYDRLDAMLQEYRRERPWRGSQGSPPPPSPP